MHALMDPSAAPTAEIRAQLPTPETIAGWQN
jgi:hypothetical protein